MNRSVNVAIDCVCIVFTMLLLFYLCFNVDRKQRLNRIFVWICVCNIGLLAGDIPNWLCEGFAKSWFPAVLWWGCFIQYISGCFIPLFYTFYLREYLLHKVKYKDYLLYFIIGLFSAALFLLLMNIHNGLYYYINASNVYVRGEWYVLSQLFPVLILLINAGIIISNCRVLKWKEVFAFLGYQLLTVVAISIQYFAYGVVLTYLASSVAIYIIFLCIQSEQRLVLEQQKRDLDKAGVMIMLSQIQPHFIYNTLVGIKQLCDMDSKQASDALEHFSFYLRGNLDSLSDSGLIEFTKEMEHIKDYLYLEKMRFSERLKIDLEITYEDFMLPSLTVQPIVENAVRHGIMKRRDGGTLTIKSERAADDIIITVSDDGIGFNPREQKKDGHSHIGISNVRNRLKLQCGGTLVIKSEIGVGTEVKIIIPLSK